MTEESIFLAAIEMSDPGQRAAFVEQSCAGDDALRQRVEALLDSHDHSGGFLKQPALGPVGDDDGTVRNSKLFDTIAPPYFEKSKRPGGPGRMHHYEILGTLGEGGFGIVYKAFDETLQRVVAIKVLDPRLAARAVDRERFVREARAAAAVRHDNVINIYSVERLPTPFFVMEFIDGPSLQQKLDRVGPLPIKEILRIGMQTAEGLAAAHKQGLIHRDIKPGNILLENGVERVKISDFGLARAMNDATLTEPGIIAGTPHYMSPEQADSKPVDQRSDLFSLGSVLYALCTGRPPFRSDSAVSILRQVCDHPPRPIREINPDIPLWLVAIVDKLHAKAPEDRYQTASEVADVLAKKLSAVQLGTIDAESRTAKPLGGRRRRVGLGLAAIGVLLACAAVFVAVNRPQVPADLTNHLSPADALDRAKIPERLLAMNEVTRATPELVAILGDARFLSKNGGNRESGMMDLAVSGDRKFLATATAVLTESGFERPEVRLWDTANGQTLRKFPETGSIIRALALNPDGSRLAAGSMDGVIRIWDTATGELAHELKEHRDFIRSLAWSPDGKWLASGARDRKVIVWDSAGVKKLSFDNHFGEILHVAFSPDSKRIVSTAGEADRSARVWEAETGREIALLPRVAIPRASVFCPDGKRIVTVGEDPVGHVWDIETREMLRELRGHTDWLITVAASADGRSLATTSVDGTIRTWDAATGKPLHVESGSFLFPTAMAFLDGGETLVSGDCAGSLSLWDVATGERKRAQHTGPSWTLAVDADGARLASGGEDKTVRLWDLSTGALLHTLKGHPRTVTSVAWNKNQLASASRGEVKLWDTGSAGPPKEIASLTGVTGEVEQIAFSPDGRRLAAVELDGPLHIWNPSRKTPLKTFSLGGGRSLAYSPDGRTLAVGDKNTIRLLDAETLWEAGALTGHTGDVLGLAFSPDGARLASAESGDGSTRIWDWKARKEIRRLDDHAGGANACLWRADGAMLVTCGLADGTVRLWDLTRDPPLAWTIRVGISNLKFDRAIALTPEGRHLAATNPDGIISLYRLGENTGK